MEEPIYIEFNIQRPGREIKITIPDNLTPTEWCEISDFLQTRKPQNVLTKLETEQGVSNRKKGGSIFVPRYELEAAHQENAALRADLAESNRKRDFYAAACSNLPKPN